MPKPLSEFMQDALVNESFHYEDHDKTRSQIQGIYSEVGKPYKKMQSELEEMKTRMSSVDRAYELIFNLKEKLGSFNDWYALIKHMNQGVDENEFNDYRSSIENYFKMLNNSTEAKMFTKYIKEYREIFTSLVFKVEEFKSIKK